MRSPSKAVHTARKQRVLPRSLGLHFFLLDHGTPGTTDVPRMVLQAENDTA
jgi:hypothetical protein